MATHYLIALLIITSMITPTILVGAQGEASIPAICTDSCVYDFCIKTYKEILPNPGGATIIELNEKIIQKSFDNSTNTQLYIVDLLGNVTDEEQKQALSVCVQSFLNISLAYHNALGYLHSDHIAVLDQEREASAAQLECTASFDAQLSLSNEQMKNLDAIALAAARILLQRRGLLGRRFLMNIL